MASAILEAYADIFKRFRERGGLGDETPPPSEEMGPVARALLGPLKGIAGPGETPEDKAKREEAEQSSPLLNLFKKRRELLGTLGGDQSEKLG